MNNIAFRKSNFELLRIVAMFIIVLCHSSIHSVILSTSPENTQISGFLDIRNLNYLLALLFAAGGKMGVNIFVLVTGYFMIDLSFKISSFVKIYILTFFYSTFF